MAIKLFVGGLAYTMSDDDLRNLFAEHGTVASAQIIVDRATNQSKGFGFVEMSTDDESNAAVAALNGKDMNGRPLTVNVARPKEDRPRTGGGDDHRSGGNSVGNNFRRSYR
jgi:RNA recognition motif-containing protein